MEDERNVKEPATGGVRRRRMQHARRHCRQYVAAQFHRRHRGHGRFRRHGGDFGNDVVVDGDNLPGEGHRYDIAVDSVAQYAKELVGDANQVYKAKVYSLKAGQASLLEVLDAHRAINEVYIGYYDALSEQAKALIALEHAAGIWDINF